MFAFAPLQSSRSEFVRRPSPSVLNAESPLLVLRRSAEAFPSSANAAVLTFGRSSEHGLSDRSRTGRQRESGSQTKSCKPAPWFYCSSFPYLLGLDVCSMFGDGRHRPAGRTELLARRTQQLREKVRAKILLQESSTNVDGAQSAGTRD